MIDYLGPFILILSVGLRLFPRLRWKEFNGTDSQFHYYYTQLIRNNNNRMPVSEPRVIGGSNECTYPYFYHWLLSFASTGFLDFWDKYSGFVFDFLNSLIVVFLLSHVVDIDVTEACLLIATYLIAPGLTFSFIGPRPFTLTPRNFSQFIFAAGCMGLVLMAGSQGTLFFILFAISALSFAVLLLSSQFGLQVLVFILMASIFSWEIPAAIAAGTLIALPFDKGFLVRQIVAQVRHLEWYFKYNYDFVKHKTNFSNLFRYLSDMDVRNVFYELVFYNQISTTLLRHTTFFLALGLGAAPWYDHALLPEQYMAYILLLPLLAAFIITNIGKARVFGEAERYVEFSYPIQTFLFFSLISHEYWLPVLFGILLYNFVWYTYNLYQIRSQSALNYSYANIFNLLNDEQSTLLCLSNNESYLFLKNTPVKLVGFLVNISLRGAYGAFFDRFFTRYPCVNPQYITEIYGNYSITHILYNKTVLQAYEYDYKEVVENVCGFAPIYEDEKYVLYKK